MTVPEAKIARTIPTMVSLVRLKTVCSGIWGCNSWRSKKKQKTVFPDAKENNWKYTDTFVVSLQDSKTWIHSQDSHWCVLIDPLLVLTWLLPMQMTDFFAAKMVMLYCWSALWVTQQLFWLQTDISHSSWMEQFTDMVVMLHSSSDWFENIRVKMRTGFGTAPGGSKNDWSQLVWFGFLCNPKFNRDLIWMHRAHA